MARTRGGLPWRRPVRWALGLVLLGAVLSGGVMCGGGTITDPGLDASAGGDSGSSSDSASGADAGCETGCRLFSVFCDTAPCTCASLASSDPDPICDGGIASCTVDPCANKTAVCTASGCAVQ